MLKAAQVRQVILIVQAENNKRGTMFSAENVTKKGDRKWACRLDVRKHLKGGSRAYDFNEKNLLSVWDPNAKGDPDKKYRCIQIDTLKYLRAAKVELVVNGRPTKAYNTMVKQAQAMIELADIND